MRLNFPRLTPVVKWLIIINISAFVITFLFSRIDIFALRWLSAYPASIGKTLQIWRLITYQFLHNTSGFGHILWNMVILYFIGTLLENHWNSRKFLVFYLICGAAGGVLYPILVLVGWLEVAPLIGASGAILGLLTASAILFPNIRFYVFGIFPIRLSILAIILCVISIFSVIRPDRIANAGGEAAHLAGMAAGAAYVLSGPWRSKFNIRKTAGQRWENKMTEKRNLRIELDRILDKVHRSGIHSLTSKEKRTLKKATKAEQMRNRY
jgi:membrane associated rhomboid family serine protease